MVVRHKVYALSFSSSSEKELSSMGEGEEKMVQAPAMASVPNAKQKDQWLIMEAEADDDDDNIYNASSSLDNSTTSNGSTSSSDMVDDASSPTSILTSSSNSNNGPLFEFSQLMAHLPVK